MSIEYFRYDGKEYAIVYAVIDGRLVVFDVGLPRQPCTSDFYIIPAKPEEAREVVRAWLSRMPRLKDGIKPVPA